MARARELLGDVQAKHAAGVAAAEPEQLPLLHSGKVDLNDAAQVAAAAAQDRKAGRPVGSTGKNRREFNRFIDALIGDPAVRRAQWLQLSPEEFARRMDCTVLEAWDRQNAILESLQRLRYAPLAPVADDGKPVPYLQLNLGDHAATRPDGSVRLPWDYIQPDEQNQPLTIDGKAQSQDEEPKN